MILFFSILAAILLGAGYWLRAGFHRRLHRQLAAPREPVTCSLADHGLEGETLQLPTCRGRQLEAWWLQASAPRGHLILTHGWGANRESLLPLAPLLLKAGWNLLLIDVRNHGNSDGDTFSSMPRFSEDIDAALDWLDHHQDQALAAQRSRRDAAGGDGAVVRDGAVVERYPHPLPRGLIGHSVGAAATLLAASRRQDLEVVVSLSSFAHPEDMMRRWLKAHGMPFFPLGWYVLGFVERVIGDRFDTIAPVNTLPRIACPVLLVHGEDDTVIPLDDARRLARAGRPGQVVLRSVEGGHDLTVGLTHHGDELVAFLAKAARRRQGDMLANQKALASVTDPGRNLIA